MLAVLAGLLLPDPLRVELEVEDGQAETEGERLTREERVKEREGVRVALILGEIEGVRVP